jgi:hypothetical protein
MGGSGGIHQAFGLRLRTHFPLPELPSLAARAPVDVDIRAAPADAVDAAFSGPAEPRATRHGLLGDGGSYRTERGRDGDLRIEYAERATFHLAADRRDLRCWAADPDELSWRRFLLDTVLGTVALERGFEALHAGAFEHDGEAVAVVAPQGGGKSTLLAELVRRGRPLFCDDVLALSGAGGRSVAHPGPPLMSLSGTLPDPVSAPGIGRVLGVVDGERWIAIERGSTQARPLGAVVFFARRGQRRTAVHRVPPNPAPLLSQSLPSGRDPARLERRFALFADIAARVLLLRLRVPLHLPPAKAADVLELALDRTRARGSAA